MGYLEKNCFNDIDNLDPTIITAMLETGKTFDELQSEAEANNISVEEYVSNYNDYDHSGEADNLGEDCGSGSSGNGGGKIICAELFRQGYLEQSIYQADEAFGEFLKQKYPLVLEGYQFWARSIVNLMKRSKIFTEFVYRIAKPWTDEMAHIMGKRQKGNFAGKILMYFGFVICLLIGIFTRNVFGINYILIIIIGIFIFIRWKHIRIKELNRSIVRITSKN